MYDGKARRRDVVSAPLWVKIEVIPGHGGFRSVIYISKGKRLQNAGAGPNSDLRGWCQHVHWQLR